jgi:acetoin:2,6-dichlorophenolindophenol oxidoreductase subunit alpha
MTTQAIEPRMELEQNLHMYRQMAKIRAFEEQVHELYKSAKMPGLAHLYVGEEGVAVGVCEAATTSSPAPIAATATAWPKAPR